jgi:hypothetical protein
MAEQLGFRSANPFGDPMATNDLDVSLYAAEVVNSMD